MSTRRRGKPKLSWYEIHLIAVASLVGIGGGSAIAMDTEGSSTGAGVGQGMGLTLVALIGFSVAPAVSQVMREVSGRGDWRGMKDPHRERFRKLMVQHILYSWSCAIASSVVALFLYRGSFELWIAFVLIGVLIAALFVASLKVRKDMQLVWEDE